MRVPSVEIQNCWTSVFVVAGIFVLLFPCPNVATAGYADSAHGNTSYGVDRSGTTYATGSCAHCHDTFDESICGVNVLMLFDLSDKDFCLGCHDNTMDPSDRAIVNRSYSYRAGGYTTDPVDDVEEAFSLASSHDLDDIRTFINGKWGYTAKANPCTACHNQHLAQGDPQSAPDAAKSGTTRGWPVSRPSEHNVGTWNLWGDDLTERMSAYTSHYQAPYRKSSMTTYEPDGSTTTDGSNLTDFNTFCTDCHNTTYTIYSAALGRDLIQIDWDNEIHGKGDANESLCGDNPYPSGTSGLGKVLSCLDCHEPHGSPNVTLIRREVNGNILGTITTISQVGCEDRENQNKEMANLCNRCHQDDNQIDSGCTSNRWYKIHHKDPTDPGCNTDSPYYYRTWCGACHLESDMGNWNCNNEDVTPISCNCCHYHGSIVDNCYYEPTTRRTF